MFELFTELNLLESQRQADVEKKYAIESINDVYREWKKTGRRKNAVNIVNTSINKITTINPDIIDHINDSAKMKLAVIIMRCLDLPIWTEVEAKRIPYRRLFPLLDRLQNLDPNTSTGGSLRDIVMTRLSASISNKADTDDSRGVFVAYEPKVNKRYIKFMFGDTQPEHVCRMQALSLPKDFDTLINTLNINHSKACERYLKAGESDND